MSLTSRFPMFPGAFLVLVLSANPAGAQTVPPQPPSIVAQGEATVRKAPDRAWFSVAVETRDTRAAEARRVNTEAMTAAQSALKAAGVSPDAIRTTGYSVVPDMEWNNGRSVMRGYVVRNQIDVRVDDITKLAETMESITAMNRTALSIVGPRFDLKDERAAQNEALRLAVESALSRAEALAAGARRSLGNVIKIETKGVSEGPRPMPMMRQTAMIGGVAAAPPPPPPITPGEIEITAQVAVTIELR